MPACTPFVPCQPKVSPAAAAAWWAPEGQGSREGAARRVPLPGCCSPRSLSQFRWDRGCPRAPARPTCFLFLSHPGHSNGHGGQGDRRKDRDKPEPQREETGWRNGPRMSWREDTAQKQTKIQMETERPQDPRGEGVGARGRQAWEREARRGGQLGQAGAGPRGWGSSS